MKKTLAILITMILGISLNAFGKVSVKNTKVLVMPENSQQSSFAEFSKEVLPTKIESTDKSSAVMYKIMDSSLYYFYNNSGLKETSIGRVADNVEKKMRAEVNLGSDKNKVNHKLSFKVFATQALAKLEYFGWFKAAVNYDAKAAQTKAEISEELSKHQDLVLSHAIASDQSTSQLSLRWDW